MVTVADGDERNNRTQALRAMKKNMKQKILNIARSDFEFGKEYDLGGGILVSFNVPDGE